ncbi:MAG: GTPase domain-containing protein [Deltaproteobacteria bacterium]|nr:GTPase domain-containing protein [Deltaproteobacteria bacterium]
MAVIDSTKKEINFKIVYYGPAHSGKTTSIRQLQSKIEGKKSGVKKLNGLGEHTIFFDFLALSSSDIGGYKTRFQIYTVPGQVLYEDSRKLLLQGVDGIIFVADSQMERVADNLSSLTELKSHLQQMGHNPQEVPMVIQYNKRDLPQAPPLEELRKTININHVPDFETVATQGSGVLESFKECARQVLLTLKDL